MHRKLRSCLIGCSLLFSAAFPANTALAAAKYKRVKLGYNSTDKVSVGKYSFKINKDKVLLVTKDNKTQKTPMNYMAFIAGSTDAVYIKSGTLYRYTYKTGKSSKLHKFPMGKKLQYGYANDYSIGGVIGNKVYINCTDETDETDALISKYVLIYDLKSGSVTRSAKSRYISDSADGYGVALESTANDPSPYSIFLYKLTGTGMTFIKKFTDDGHGGHIVGKKVYYFDDTTKAYSLKEYDINSKKTKTIKSIKKKTRYDFFYGGEMTDSYAVINTGEYQYKVTYKNGKTVKSRRGY